MRNLKRNKKRLYYATFKGNVDVYKEDGQGNVIYDIIDGQQVPLKTGKTVAEYNTPIEFYGNISTVGGGDSQIVEFGVDTSSYSAVLVVDDDLPIFDELVLIWSDTEPIIDENEKVDTNSADYNVVKVSNSLNQHKYLLEKRIK